MIDPEIQYREIENTLVNIPAYQLKIDEIDREMERTIDLMDGSKPDDILQLSGMLLALRAAKVCLQAPVIEPIE
jgi:hypothetical protein